MTRYQSASLKELKRQHDALQKQKIKTTADWEKLRELSKMIDGMREDSGK